MDDRPQHEKIMDLHALAEILSTLKERGKTIVLCHGVFDLLHIGHIRYFEQARRMGDILVVTITPDRDVDKGPHRPAFDEPLRAEAIASLNSVDFVAINKWPTAEETLRLLRPNLFVKGSEFKNIHDDPTGKIALEAAVAEEIGTQIAFTDDIVFSSSNLINRYLSNYPKEINDYLELFRKRYHLEDILSVVDTMADARVLVVGDTILDEYQYCSTIGKSSKDPTLVLQHQSHELFAGGVLAVANHVANFSDHVQLLTTIGEKNTHLAFIKDQLHPHVSLKYAVQPGAPTLIKRRYIDSYSFNKLFEVYEMDDSGLPERENREICTWLRENIGEYDLVIASDFGHGTISDEMIDILSSHSRFLAVNTQANAGNRGFHTISKYPRADYVSIAEHELRLEFRARNGLLRPKMETLIEKMGCRKCVVTTGRKGCAIANNDGVFVQVPSFAQQVVDRVGAGDAFLSVTSLAAIQEVPSEVIGFLGNIVGALAVEIIGNKKAIDKMSVKKYITSLMK